ncbi:hypothetical protein M0805_000143 [Coniferiporia weirii]|nr:hypothetical protein M0805_000143 [Coniferiporia weirii]
MAGILTILLMSTILGATSFSIGMLPLFFTFSRTRIAYLSTLSTGLLLGAALGIIIPEGIETLVSSPSSSDPATKIALSLLSGFAFMLLVEQFSGHHEHSHKHPHSPLPTTAPLESLHPFRGAGPHGLGGNDSSDVFVSGGEFDMGLSELENAGGSGLGHPTARADDQTEAEKARALPLTLGLVIHSLADGLALGASALPRNGGGDGDNAGASNTNFQLSFLVFLALIVHKAPTALALSMSLLSKTLSFSECRKHLAAFSVSTPLGALASFGVLSFLGAGAGDGEWTGIALLVSGGTFLYVATVLQPMSQQDSSTSSSPEMGEKARAGLIIAGMFVPFSISLAVGHGH